MKISIGRTAVNPPEDILINYYSRFCTLRAEIERKVRSKYGKVAKSHFIFLLKIIQKLTELPINEASLLLYKV